MVEKICSHIRQNSAFVVITIICGCLGLTIVIVLYASTQKQMTIPVEVLVEPTSIPDKKNDKLSVDVSGAVRLPGLYSLEEGARVQDALMLAGGLSNQADKDFFARNYNVASILFDQQKIYIPRQDEISDGVFVEGRYFIDGQIHGDFSNSQNGTYATDSLERSRVHVNSASQAEIENLPGIGPVIAKKIIDNRPYVDIIELKDKKIVSAKIFDGLKDVIDL